MGLSESQNVHASRTTRSKYSGHADGMCSVGGACHTRSSSSGDHARYSYCGSFSRCKLSRSPNTLPARSPLPPSAAVLAVELLAAVQSDSSSHKRTPNANTSAAGAATYAAGCSS